MSKPVIAIDIDDVLSANAEAFTAFSNQRFGTSLQATDYDEHWARMWGVDMAETERRAVEFHASGVVAEYSRKDNAREVLQELSSRYKLIVVTSRRRSIESHTRAWIAEQYPDIFDDILFAGIYDEGLKKEHFQMTKSDLFTSSAVSFVIDDQLKHCLAAVELGIETILFGNYSWNQADELPALLTRCENWLAVGEYFDKRN